MNLIQTRKGLVTVGIVTWNSEKDLPSCLEAIAAQEYSDIEIVVVDNNSSDDSAGIIRKVLPESRMIINEKNTGYCVAHNAAIRAARGEYYLPLNPDVVMQPGFIGQLVNSLQNHPQGGSAGGKVLQSTGEVPPLFDSTGLFLDRRRHQYLRGYGKPDRNQYNQPEQVFGADGAAPLLRRSMLEDTAIFGEYFDEQYFTYMEDVDLAWRARLFGWGCWYEPRAVAIHQRSFKPGNRRCMPKILRRMAVKNRILTILKNECAECWRRDWPRILMYDFLIWSYVLVHEWSSLGAIPLLRSQWNRAISWRKEVHRRMRVKPAECLSWFR